MMVWIWVVIALAVVVVILALLLLARSRRAFGFSQRRRSEQLRAGFGPEYDRTVNQYSGDQSRAEAELMARQARVEQLDIRSLAPADRDRFAEAWRATQARFVDDPVGAIAQADRLIADIMWARGYPVGEFEQRASDISVNHPNVVTNYRAAHTISLASANGQASTEDLRRAMIHYRALFMELLEMPNTAQTEVG
jgi:hypothetical protein